MLKPSLVPTPLITEDERPHIQIVPLSNSRHSTVGVIFALVRLIFSLIGSSLRRQKNPQADAQRLRQFLEEMGGLWVKAGQLISLRRDVLTPEMTDELTQLQYRAFGFAPDVARQILTDTLGVPITTVFEQFEDHPFAAASISQVHRGFLRREQVWVAIKIQRPDIVPIFERDLRLISWLLRQMGKLPATGFIDWDGMIKELQDIMREEIDYRYESSNLRFMRQKLKAHKVYVPKFFRRYSGPRVITMEMITGVLMSDYLRVQATDPERLSAWCEENRVRPRKVGRRLLFSFYRQLFEDNLFHGDLHPGNIVLLRNSRLALIDLGTVGNLEPRFVTNYYRQAVAVANREYAKAAELYLMMADSLPIMDVTAFRTEMVALYRNWEARSRLRDLSYYEKSISGGAANDVQTIARKYKVNPSWQFLRVGRAISTLDANLNVLLGNSDPTKLIRRYNQGASRRRLRNLFKNGVSGFVNTATDITQTISFASDMVRRQALQFQGAATTGARIARVVLGWLRFGLFLAALVFLYDLIHYHANSLVQWLHPWLGPVADIAEAIPSYELDIGITILLGVLLLVIFVSRIRSITSQKTLRLPDGRLDR